MFKLPRVLIITVALSFIFGVGVYAVGALNPEAQKHFAAAVGYQKAGKLNPAIQEYQAGLKLEPNCAPALGNLGMIYLQRNQMSKAEGVFRRIVAIDPKNPAAIEQLARILLAQRKAKDAAPLVRQLIATKPKEIRYQQLLAACAMMSNDYPTAVGIYKSLIHADPKNPANYEALMSLYMGKQSYAEAIQAAEMLLKVDPSQVRARMTAGFAAEKMGDKAAAVKYYQSATSGPGAKSAYLNLARLYSEMKQPDKSLAALNSILKTNKNDFEANFNLGAYEYSKQHWDKAEKYWLAARKTRPTDPTINLNIGLARARQGHFKDALACTTIAVNGMPKSVLALEAHAYVLECLNEFDKAIGVYKRWEKLDPQNCVPNQKIGMDYIGLHKPDSAWPQFDLAMKKAPKSADVAATYAGLLFSQKEYAKAHKMYAKAMELNPKDVNIVVRAADCLDADKKQAESIKILEKAVSTFPDNVVGRRRLAYEYIAQNNNDLAIAQYKKLFEDNPKSCDDGASLAQLYTAKGDHKAAAEIYGKLVKSCPPERLPFYHYLLGSALENTQDYDGALQQYAEVVKSTQKAFIPDAYKQMGGVYEKQGKIAEAIDAYKKSASARPADEEVYAKLEKLYIGQKKQDEYLAYLKSLLAESKDPLPFRAFADAFRKAGKADDGIGALESVVARMPDNVQPALALASEYAKSNLNDKAIERYKAVLDKFADPAAYAGLGKLYLAMGKKKDAADCLVHVTGDKDCILQAAELYREMPDQRTAALNAYREYEKLDPANEDVKKKRRDLEAGETPAVVPPEKPATPTAPEILSAPGAPGPPTPGTVVDGTGPK